MSFNASIHIRLEADNFSDLLQKVSTLHASYPIESAQLRPEEYYQLRGQGAISGGVNLAASEQASAPKPAAAKGKAAKTPTPPTDTAPAAGAAASSPATAAAPAPAPAAASAKSPDELLSDLRAVLAPVAGKSAKDRADVNTFVTGLGYKMITAIPFDKLPEVIAAAKERFPQ